MMLLGYATGAMAQVGPSAPAPVAPAKIPVPLSAEVFAAPPFMEDPELSPNGQFLAARMSANGQRMLAIFPLYDKSIAIKSLGIGDGKTSVDWWRWVNDEWLLIGLSATVQAEGEEMRISRVSSFSRLTGKVVKLGWDAAGQNGARIIWTAKDGSPRILLGMQKSIYLGPDFWTEIVDMDVSTGKSSTVVRSRTGVMHYYADGAGNVRLGYGYDDSTRTARLLYRPDGKGSFRVIDRANFRRDERLNFPDTFLAAPDQAVTISDDEGGFSALYELDLKTMERGKKIFGVPGYDIGGTIETASGDGVAGVMVTEDASRVHWLDPGLAQVQAEIDKAVGKSRAHVVSWDRARRKLLLKVGGADQAGAYYLFDREGAGTMERIAFVDEKLRMAKQSAVTTIGFKARDGVDMRGVLTLPKGREAKNLPLILLPHGGPEARDSESWDWWVQFLAWRGYVVFQPNYRGSTGFGTKFMKLGDGEWGLKMQDDLNDAVSYLAKQGIIDAKRVCVVGASYGGYAAMRAAQRDGALYRCAISYAGVSDLPKMRRYDGQFLNGGSMADSWNESAPKLEDVSPLRHADTFSAPILLMHGKLDLRVPVSQSRQMADRLKAAGKAHRYVEQPLGDHHFSRTEDRLQFLKEMDGFLKQHNPPD
jgi:dienelactone hydrolase